MPDGPTDNDEKKICGMPAQSLNTYLSLLCSVALIVINAIQINEIISYRDKKHSDADGYADAIDGKSNDDIDKLDDGVENHNLMAYGIVSIGFAIVLFLWTIALSGHERVMSLLKQKEDDKMSEEVRVSIQTVVLTVLVVMNSLLFVGFVGTDDNPGWDATGASKSDMNVHTLAWFGFVIGSWVLGLLALVDLGMLLSDRCQSK